jgi:hypothetical protein
VRYRTFQADTFSASLFNEADAIKRHNFDTELDKPTLATAENPAKRMIYFEINLRLLPI